MVPENFHSTFVSMTLVTLAIYKYIIVIIILIGCQGASRPWQGLAMVVLAYVFLLQWRCKAVPTPGFTGPVYYFWAR